MKNRSVFFKLFSFILSGLLLMEVILQIMAATQVETGGFYDFLQKLPDKIKEVEGEKVIYFVGDSTVYGIGATDHELYALPVQFEALLRRAGLDFRCVNLGYPGTCTEEHLLVLSFLPEGANVIYRGGVSDQWNPGQNAFRFYLAGKMRELRVLRMMSLLLRPFFPVDDEQRRRDLHFSLRQMVSENSLNFMVLDYFEPLLAFDFFYELSTDFSFIPLARLLQEQGFSSDGRFKVRFRSVDNNHSNNLGYLVEAGVIFNYFCDRGLFGLSSRKKLAVEKQEFLQFGSGLEERYIRQKADLRSLGPESLPGIIFMLNEVWFLADLLRSLYPQNKVYVQEVQKMERLMLLVFHDFRVGHARARFAPDEDFLRLYEAVMRATLDADSVHWSEVRDIVGSQMRVTDEISFLPDLAPYPLEKCQRFLQESGYRAEELSSSAEWEYFFTIPYEIFTPEKGKNCIYSSVD
jgi:hypothetical protein